jgi:hypothetical protein
MGRGDAYIMKIRGVNHMPDSVQVRDENFRLIAYFRADKPQDVLLKIFSKKTIKEITGLLTGLPYGHMVKITY